MKRCPTCNKTFDEQNLSFCVDDGTPLVPFDQDEETRVSPSASGPSSSNQPIGYQPPHYVTPSGKHPRQRAWPWVLGLVALLVVLLVGLGIAAAVLVPRLMRASNNSNANTNQNRIENRNSNANRIIAGNENNVSNVSDDARPPTDEQQVLAQLTDLENEWTVANINADKKALDRILADDYVSILDNGRPQGKAEYLKTIERDTTIQKWNFEDLKVALIGDRATLEGVLRLQIQGQEVLYAFTDKFVWREGRWQAIGSEVKRIESTQTGFPAN